MDCRISILTLVAAAVLLPPPVSAQVIRRSDVEASKPGDPVPQSSTSTFGNWTLICQETTAGSESKPTKRCEVSQTILDAKKRPLIHIAAGVDPTGRRSMVVLTPVSIRVEVPVTIKIESPATTIVLPFRYCLPSGCYAESDLSDVELNALRGNPEPKAALDVVNVAKADVRVPLSLLGFDAAWQAYSRDRNAKH